MASRESVRHARVEMGFASTITLRIGFIFVFHDVAAKSRPFRRRFQLARGAGRFIANLALPHGR